jgi:hypothetical protein
LLSGERLSSSSSSGERKREVVVVVVAVGERQREILKLGRVGKAWWVRMGLVRLGQGGTERGESGGGGGGVCRCRQ